MDYININKNSWNTKVDYHLKSDFYFVEEFIAGRTSLNEPELKVLRCKDNYVSLNKKRWKYLKEKI